MYNNYCLVINVPESYSVVVWHMRAFMLKSLP